MNTETQNRGNSKKSNWLTYVAMMLMMVTLVWSLVVV